MPVRTVMPLATALLLSGLLLGPAACRSKAEKPGVLLVTVDALRPDRLGCYGQRGGSSPNIDRLARRGVLFTQAVVQASWTVPSVYSILTGTYPSTHDVRFWDQVLPKSVASLPSALRRAGYRTALFTSHGVLAANRPLRQLFGAGKGFAPADEAALCDHALRWIARERGRPFFVWVHLMDTHTSQMGVPQGKVRREDLTAGELKRLHAAYDRGVRRADRMLGRLLRGLAAAGRERQTLVVLSADHGEELCEHGLCFHHGNELWDAVIRVPLIVSRPAVYSGRRVTEQVELIDLAPTIYELAGLELGGVEGRSLRPLLVGGSRPARTAIAEHIERDNDLSTGPWSLTRVAARTLEWKAMVTVSKGPHRSAAFDLRADPREQRPLPLARAPAGLRARVRAFLGRRPPRRRAGRRRLDERQRRKLRSLGYIQ